MIKLLLISSAVAMAPRTTRPKKIRGVPEHKWSFDILTKWKKDGEHAQIVATDARGEVGWFEVLRSRGGNVLHAPLKNEPVVERAFGTNVMTEPEVRRKGVATALFHRAEEIVREWDLNEFLLTCVRHHEPSYNLYRKLGFEEVDAEIARDSDSVMMRKFVPTPTRTD